MSRKHGEDAPELPSNFFKPGDSVSIRAAVTATATSAAAGEEAEEARGIVYRTNAHSVAVQETLHSL